MLDRVVFRGGMLDSLHASFENHALQQRMRIDDQLSSRRRQSDESPFRFLRLIVTEEMEMSGPIVRTGTTPEFWKNYDNIFGKKKAAPKKAAPATAAAAPAKKATKKAAKKATKKKA